MLEALLATGAAPGFRRVVEALHATLQRALAGLGRPRVPVDRCRGGIKLPPKGYTPQSLALRPCFIQNSKILPMGIKPVQERPDPFRDARPVGQTLQSFAPLCTWEVTP